MTSTEKTANGEPQNEKTAVPPKPAKILAIDIGGSKVKALVTGETEPRRMPSGKELTPARMVEGVRELAKDWDYEAVSIGYPGLVGNDGPRSEPGNLGSGWVGFHFAAAFDRPVRIINDAAMQALGSYDGGRMLFLGLGTGLGSTLIAENVIIPLELGQLRYTNRRTLGETLGRQGRKASGDAAWNRSVRKIVPALIAAFVVDYAVLGGGNARKVKRLPHAVRLGHNLTAFRGGFRLWGLEDVKTQHVDGAEPQAPPQPIEWRLI